MSDDPDIDPDFAPGDTLLQYQFPRSEQQSVVRIPVSGPEPFNTLVVVRGVFWMSVAKVANLPGGPEYHPHRDLLYFQGNLVTNFKLEGFDPRVEPPFNHSTTAALQMFQHLQKLPFLDAVDQILKGFFNADGKWVVKIRVAGFAEALGGARAYLSSWVLCHEPPPNPQSPRGPSLKFQDYGKPPRIWSAEPDATASDDLDRKLKRLSTRRKRRSDL